MGLFLTLIFAGMIALIAFFLSYVYVLAALPGLAVHVFVREILTRYKRARVLMLPVVHALFFAPVTKSTTSELLVLPIVWLDVGAPFSWAEHYGQVLLSGLTVFFASLGFQVWRSNSTPHPDARDVPASASDSGARAGGRER